MADIVISEKQLHKFLLDLLDKECRTFPDILNAVAKEFILVPVYDILNDKFDNVGSDPMGHVFGIEGNIY